MASRGEILSLYKRCLRSMMRIPDVDQRAVYRVYVCDGFRDKVALPEGCKQATTAIGDAREQLERMDYYHSIREMKERQRSERQNGCLGGSSGMMSASPSTPSREPSRTENSNPIHVAASDKSNDGKDERYFFARNWLLRYIPHLHQEDVVIYSKQLVDDGFDCEESFLELCAEDLNFMKLAHRRAVVRALFS